jgi:putative sugar O-methyltransferase
MTTDYHVLLDQMLADMSEQQALHQPTPFWREASDRIITELRTHGFEGFRNLPSVRDFFVPSYGPPGNLLSLADVERLENLLLADTARSSKKHATVLEMLKGKAWALADYRVFLAADRIGLAPDLSRVSESQTGIPPDQVEFEGRRFSRSFLNYLHGLVFLKQQLGDTPIRSVLEIGGGYGTLGEILHQSGGGYAYVDVDIPPTAAVASYYLSQQPGLRIADYLEHRGAREIAVPRAGEQAVLCPWQLDRLMGRVDLFWNFISFQEMEPAVVRFYLEQARRLEARYILLRNLREGKQRRVAGSSVGVDEPVLGSDYDRFLPDYEIVATNVFPFGYRTVDGYHSELRLYVRR